MSISDVTAFKPPSKKRGLAETTILESTDDYRERIPGFKDGQECTIRLRMHKTQYATLDTAFESDTIPNWNLKQKLLSGEATATRWTFLGTITDLGPLEASVDGEKVWEADVTIMPTGKITFTAGAA